MNISGPTTDLTGELDAILCIGAFCIVTHNAETIQENLSDPSVLEKNLLPESGNNIFIIQYIPD